MSAVSIYTDDLAEKICDRLAAGESLVQICRDDDMPGLRTVMRWAAENAAFGTEYGRAREAQAEVMDDKIMSTADEAGKDAAAARVKIEAYKWRAAKLAPKRYGDKTTTELTGKDGAAIEIDQRVREDADAVTSAIAGLAIRAGTPRVDGET